LNSSNRIASTVCLLKSASFIGALIPEIKTEHLQVAHSRGLVNSLYIRHQLLTVDQL